jgi:intein-encoded DNA endonuclease-like protein
VNGKHYPYGSTRQFKAVPAPELAYVVGVVKGDATVDVQQWSYRIRLRVLDKEFVEEFDRCVSKLIGSPRRRTKLLPRRNLWSVEISSVLLNRFLIQPLSRMRPLVGHCANCESGFLRGFFDSEASVSGRSLTVSNTNLSILRFVRSLLSRRGILTTGPRLQMRAGRTVVIKGKAYHANKNQYMPYVRAASLQNYAQKVGFVVQRKQRALAEAVGSRTE